MFYLCGVGVENQRLRVQGVCNYNFAPVEVCAVRRLEPGRRRFQRHCTQFNGFFMSL